MKKQTVLTASTATVAVLLAIALTAMVNWLGFRHYARTDWTKSQIYSLSDKTLNVLKGVNSDVAAVVFMTQATPLFGEVKELLERYKAATPKLSVEFIDLDRDPVRARKLASDFGVAAADTVVFSAGDRKKYVTSDQLAEYDYSGMEMGQTPKMTGFKGEEQFTSAILGVVNPERPKICFSTGHGEREINRGAAEGLSEFKEALGRDNLDAQSVTLLQGQVPADCDVLIIPGPKVPFAEVEQNAVKSYLDNGGRALLMLDPVLGAQERPTGLEALATKYGVSFGDDLVVDPEQTLPFAGLATVFASDFKPHASVDSLRGMAVVLPVARSVTTTAAPGVNATPLLMTSAGGWGERDLAGVIARKPLKKEATDTAGPVPLAVAAEAAKSGGEMPGEPKEADTKGSPDAKRGWRLIAIGNSFFIANGELANAGNLNLGLNAVNWLAQQEQSLGIAPRAPEQVQLYLSNGQMRAITLISLLGLPGLATLLGATVWWKRRR